MKTILLSFFLLLIQISFAQKREELFNYFFKASNRGAYYFVTTEKEDSLWHRKAYYVSQKTQAMEGWYKDEACKIKHGTFNWFYTNRSIKSRENYIDGKKDGSFLSWNEKGELTDSSTYKDDHRIGIGLSWHDNGMSKDSLNFDGAGNGVQVSWYDDGNIASAGRWTNDTTKKGRWKYYHNNRQLMATEDYDNGKKIACACYDESGTKLDSLLCLEKEAEPAGGKQGWRKFLENNLQRLIDEKSRVMTPGQYTVPIRFVVGKDGSLTEFVAHTAYGKGLEEDLIKILRKAPKWTPARQWGRAVKSYHTQPVSFEIQGQ